MTSDRQEMVPVSSEKLEAQVREKFKTVSAAQKELGCGNAIHNAIMRGKIQKPLYTLLTHMDFDIAPEPTPATETANGEDEDDRLQRIIKEAVLEALTCWTYGREERQK